MIENIDDSSHLYQNAGPFLKMKSKQKLNGIKMMRSKSRTFFNMGQLSQQGRVHRGQVRTAKTVDNQGLSPLSRLSALFLSKTLRFFLCRPAPCFPKFLYNIFIYIKGRDNRDSRYTHLLAGVSVSHLWTHLPHLPPLEVLQTNPGIDRIVEGR